ncbi:TRAP transporter substrate-binding protein [Marinobacterium sp. D7]|uniref:TRAP transporter substrate-binding protein n=1 Tax=Marinobacterium ramblicola TaxID=2849041 RepID=UPI001C2D6C04|nr:TRAP transporter substrate-binding protein [Marinobacterium ramblicola]MBV1789945.1 TRAP transporter substrate-binding protein [Marinobacterium ramblicola]
MRKFFALTAAVTLATVANFANAQTRLTLSTFVPSSHPMMTDVLKPWAESVAQATDGRVEVVILPSPLGHPKVHYDLAREGQADIGYGSQGYTPGRFTLYKMVEFPFAGDSAVGTSVAYWRVYKKYLEQAGEYKDVKVLGLFTHGPGHIHNIKRTVNSKADLNGLKMRVGGGFMNDLASELGAVTLQKPSPSSYELLSSGVADGTLFPLESVVSFNVQNIVKHTTLVPGGLYNFGFFLVMNKERFEALSEQDQAAIDSVSGEALARLAGQMWDKWDAKGLEAITANGNEVVTADAAFMKEISDSAAPMEAKWLEEAAGKGVDGEAALAEFRQLSRAEQ